MKLVTVSPPDRGSLSVVYSCPECGYEMAMLTNAHETQLVSSLGVRIAPKEAEGKTAGSCPFSGMIPGVDRDAAGPEVRWTEGASSRLQSIPEFVRPMARKGIESFARERGYLEVDETVLDEARAFFGM
jgi:hypothetical protein